MTSSAGWNLHAFPGRKRNPEHGERLEPDCQQAWGLLPSSGQDGVYRLVFTEHFAQLTHPGITIEATLQFSYHAPTPSYLYTSFTTLEWLCTYAGGRRYRTVTVQDASSQHHSTALWFDVVRMLKTYSPKDLIRLTLVDLVAQYDGLNH